MAAVAEFIAEGSSSAFIICIVFLFVALRFDSCRTWLIESWCFWKAWFRSKTTSLRNRSSLWYDEFFNPEMNLQYDEGWPPEVVDVVVGDSSRTNRIVWHTQCVSAFADEPISSVFMAGKWDEAVVMRVDRWGTAELTDCSKIAYELLTVSSPLCHSSRRSW